MGLKARAQGRPVSLFYSYAHEDRALRDELEKHLSSLNRQGVISAWHDREIRAGQEWASEISRHLEDADVIVLLISADFLDSDYCYSREMRRALERHERGDAMVIPVLIRAVQSANEPFLKLQMLPPGGKPVTSWPNRDEAWAEVATGISRAITGGPAPSVAAPPLLHPASAKRRRIAVASLVGAAALVCTTWWFFIRMEGQAGRMPTTHEPSPAKPVAAADLRVSSLTPDHGLFPLDGHPLLRNTSAGPVFTGGFKAEISLSHDHKGPESIMVNRITLEVEDFDPLPRRDLAYRVNADDIVGLGTIKPRQFRLSVAGRQVGRAVWNRSPGKTIEARSDNLLDTPQRENLVLRSGADDVEALTGTVLLEKPGLYDLAFRFHYEVAGQENLKSTETIRVWRSQ